jgi:hypothetical protein
MGKKVTFSVSVEIEQFRELHLLRDRLARTASDLVREALDDLFDRHRTASADGAEEPKPAAA